MDERSPIFGVDPEQIDRLLAWPRSGEAEEASTAGLERFAEGPGAQIGRYKLVRAIGEGGMGMVYLAEQKEPVRREVALKILKPGMDSQRVLARFEVEQQALALMEHLYIARVYDAGVAASGRPYFVMEHVQGLPITEHCDKHSLTIEQRLQLFLHVCEAIQHAHQKGIIHRDLKPSNILVTIQDKEAIPKVIDFGVARAIGEPLTQRTLFTEQGQLVGTPEYMSPEQADTGNQDIDTRTDIYSLGVVLYELLAGILPFDPRTFREGGIEHIREVICKEEPKTPSTRLSKTSVEEFSECAKRRRTDVRALQRKLHGDLDWITLKALEKDRTRRYATVDAIASDIRNYLSHQPVNAAPPGVLYRVGKFARRHRQATAVAGTVILLLFVLLWAAWTHLQARRLRDERVLSRARDQDTRGDGTAALETIKPILGSRYVGSEAQLLWANILVEHRYYDEATSKLEKLLDARAEIAGAAHSLLARIIWESSSLAPQDVKKAEEHRKKAEELLPRTAEAYYVRAMTALTIHEKLDLLGEALRLDSNHYESRRLRALTYDASRKYKHLYEDALAMTLLRPRDPQGYSLLAAASKGLGDYEEAITHYDSAIEQTAPDDPQYAEFNSRRCEVLLWIGKYERVIADGQECLKHAPNATILQAHVFCALTALGRYEEASALFERVGDSGYGTRAGLANQSMKYVFDMRKAGRPWHPADRTPEGRAFWGMNEAERMCRELARKARPLIPDCFSPSWSPDGTKVAFALGLPGYSGVAVYDVASKETDLLIAPGKDPSWSPDGRHIAFVRDAEALRLSELTAAKTEIGTPAYYQGEQVWVMNADGTQPRRLARGAGWPQWSRDSKCIYYQSRVDRQLRSISIEGQDIEPARIMASANSYPSVSPDGAFVAYEPLVDEKLGEIPVAGTVLRITNLASQSCVAEWVAPVLMGLTLWSPDGRELSVGGINWDIGGTGWWVYDVDTQKAAKIFSARIVWAARSPDRTQLLIRLGGPYFEAWVANLNPALSIREALGPGQTLDEHCHECIALCNRALEVYPDLFSLHWTRTASALWIGDPNTSAYLKELEQALDKMPPGAYSSYLRAQRVFAHPLLWKRLGPLAIVLARKAVEQQHSYAKDFGPALERLGQQEEAARLWQIVAAGPKGSCRYEKESDTYTVIGSGADIWGSIDEFHFAYKKLKGDGSITAKIESIEAVHEWTKAGVMVRQSLDPDAFYAFIFPTPGGQRAFQTRTRAGIDAGTANSAADAVRLPLWIKVERRGDNFTGYYSQDGKSWIKQPDTVGTGASRCMNPQQIAMSESVYIGLAVTSHDNKKTAEARFSHVTTTGNVSPAGPFTESQDIRFQLPVSPGAAIGDK